MPGPTPATAPAPATATAAINAQQPCLTLINVYEVDPDRQADLADALARATETGIRHQPGFLSVRIHSSLDGTKVVNYAQWASKADLDGFLQRPETQAQLRAFAGLAKSVAPSLYRVNTVHTV